MTRLFNDPATFSEDMLAGFLDANAQLRRRGARRRGAGDARPRRQGRGRGRRRGRPLPGVLRRGRARLRRRRRRRQHLHLAVRAGGCVSGTRRTRRRRRAAADRQLRRRRDELRPGGQAVARARESTRGTWRSPTISPAPRPRRSVKRRGIAGDFTVFRCASAAAEEGADLDDRRTRGRKANDATRTLGVAFDGCTMPGADRPLFSVTAGTHGSRSRHPRRDRAYRATPCRPPPNSATYWCPASSPRRPAGTSDRDRGDPQRARPHQVRRTLRSVEDRRCIAARTPATGRATRGRRIGHQPRHGRLLADGDVAR